MKKRKSLQRLGAQNGEKREPTDGTYEGLAVLEFFEVKLKISEFSCQGARLCKHIFCLNLGMSGS